MTSAIAITGCGWRTPLSTEAADDLAIDPEVSRLLAGDRARPARIPFDPASTRHRRYVDRIGLHALELGRALAASLAPPAPAPHRLGLYAATGGTRADAGLVQHAFSRQGDDASASWARGLGELPPTWMLRFLSNNVHGLLAADAGARGDGAVFAGAVAGAQAVISASLALRSSAVDVAIVLAYDTLLSPEVLAAAAEAGEIARGDGVPPAPYDEAASGHVPGEAIAALVLERAADAGDRAIATIAAHTRADGEPGAPRSETLAAAAAPLAQGIDVVDGCGWSSPCFDRLERELVGVRLPAATPLTAVTATFGQLGAATSIVQAIALAACLRRRTLPAIAGLAGSAPLPLEPVLRPTRTAARTALCLSAGAPGLAAAVRLEVV